MGFFDLFRSKPDKPKRSFLGLSYDIAYFVLPAMAFEDAGQVHELWTKSPDIAGGFLFFSAGRRHGMDMGAMEDGGRFKVHHGKLDATRAYYAVEFPPPPPFDQKEMILGPYFAAVINDTASKKTECFILGQSPDGSTSLRAVTANGMNLHLGPGPAPSLEAFLEAIRRNGS